MSRCPGRLRRMLVAAAALAAIMSPATLGPAPPLPVHAATCSQQYLPDPDPACTPGVTDPRVSQDNIQQTICVPGYTRGVRPPVSYTDERKRQGIADYGYSDTSAADYEEDHLVALELGGSPTDPGNLWPEPRYPAGAGGRTAADKDRVENQLHTRVCAGDVSLAGARQAIATDWTTALDRAR
jgi:hypothetical protein